MTSPDGIALRMFDRSVILATRGRGSHARRRIGRDPS